MTQKENTIKICNHKNITLCYLTYAFMMLRVLKPLLLMVFCINTGMFTSSVQSKTPPLFSLRSSLQTGIDFKNKITERDSINILNQTNIYNGGGVGIADFNKNGLLDVYFAGNMVANKMYLNKGALHFEDVTNVAGVTGEGSWCTGV